MPCRHSKYEAVFIIQQRLYNDFERNYPSCHQELKEREEANDVVLGDGFRDSGLLSTYDCGYENVGQLGLVLPFKGSLRALESEEGEGAAIGFFSNLSLDVRTRLLRF